MHVPEHGCGPLEVAQDLPFAAQLLPEEPHGEDAQSDSGSDA